MLKLSATNDKVDHPPHYRSDTGYEAIDVIEAWGLGFNLGNVVKYISRAGHKDSSLQDLKKALWYLQREVTNRENESQPTTSTTIATRLRPASSPQGYGGDS